VLITVICNEGCNVQGLNVWAALGADTEELEDEVRSSVMKSLTAAMSATAQATGDVMEALIKYNPAFMIYKYAANLSDVPSFVLKLIVMLK
jgi:hypothetical protein